MLILHLSDIHFREPDCKHLDTDPDHSYRTNLIRHVREQVEKLGKVDAILIGGDIAFKADSEVYKAAYDWLIALAETCGCQAPERIFVVPGNHDVDRGTVKKEAQVRNAQAAIVRSDNKERELRTQFNDSTTGKSLLLPLTAYNDFAKVFGCQVYTPDHLYWKQDIPIDASVNLRVYGLTSILLSGQNGNDDAKNSLYVSPLQTVLAPADDVVNLVIIHHPPDWLYDGDDVDNAFRERAGIHMLGHKHKQRFDSGDGWVRLSAAAVIPGRDDRYITPGYNLIELSVDGQGAQRAVQLKAHQFQWQTSPDKFRAVKTKDDKDVFCARIPVPSADVKIGYPPAPPAGLPPTTSEPKADSEAAMGTEENRNIVFRFWNLTMSQRRDIALKLNLIETSEVSLPEPERYGRALLRASERHQIDALAHEIESREKK